MNFRETEHKQKKEPLWFSENRLPTDEEVLNNKGFPEANQESALKKMFFEFFEKKIGEFIDQKNNDDKYREEITPNKITKITAYLYGIYFYNFVSGGLVISKNISYNMYLKAYEKSLKLDDRSSDLSTLELDDWPISVGSSVMTGARAAADPRFGKALIYLDQFDDSEPYKTKKILIRKGNLLKRQKRIVVETNDVGEWIRTGIEEAQHLHFNYLRERRDYRTRINSGEIKDHIRETFIGGKKIIATDEETLIKNRIKSSKHENPNFNIDYNSLINVEFAAHIVQAVYTEKYDQITWNSGYKEYSKEIRANRQKYLAGNS